MAFENGFEQCRLCLSSVIPEKCIFTTEDDNKISLATKIMVCTSLVGVDLENINTETIDTVTSNDDKPQYLCLRCEEVLESFFEFRNKCLHSHFQLCFDADVITDRKSPSKIVEKCTPLNDPYLELKQEREELIEEKNEEHYDSIVTSPGVHVEQQLQFTESGFSDSNVVIHEQRMECANCLNSFCSIEELDEHWNSCGASKNKTEKWHEELTKLNFENQAVNHINSDINLLGCESINATVQRNDCEGTTKMKCRDCVKVFMDPKLFTEHLLAHSNGKRYNCRECPKTFIDHYELKYHMRIHSEDDRYKCKECGKKFPRPSSLRRHILIHSNVKPYKCKYCSKTFAHPYNVPAHERTHTGEMPYKCRFCSKSFYECSAKLKHEKNHVRSNKMFQCDICNRMFATHEEMDEHFNSHDSQMVWKCKTCKREFKKPSALKTHAQRHHDDNIPFECEICSESFALHIELKAHINIHTDDISCD